VSLNCSARVVFPPLIERLAWISPENFIKSVHVRRQDNILNLKRNNNHKVQSRTIRIATALRFLSLSSMLFSRIMLVNISKHRFLIKTCQTVEERCLL
jgi:hypothetical protein